MKEFFAARFLNRIAGVMSLAFLGIIAGVWFWQRPLLKDAHAPRETTHSPRYEIEFESGELRRAYEARMKPPSAADLDLAYARILRQKNWTALDHFFSAKEVR